MIKFRQLMLLAVAAPLGFASSFTSAQQQELNTIMQQYLEKNPEVIMQSLVKYRNLTMQKQQAAAEKAVVKNFKQLTSSTYSPVLGNAAGDVTIVEFLDYRCGHCREMSAVVDKLIAADGKVKVVVKQLPIFAGDSLLAAKAALAASYKNKFTQFHKDLLTTKNHIDAKEVDRLLVSNKVDVRTVHRIMQDSWVKEEINANMSLAKQLGLMGTPAFVVIDSDNPSNNVVIPGAVTYERMLSIVNKLRGENYSSK